VTTWAQALPAEKPPDPVLTQRLELFRLTHSDVPVLRRATPPAAWIGRHRVTAPTLAKLLDALDEIYGGAG
jgi:hypothetical protein